MNICVLYNVHNTIIRTSLHCAENTSLELVGKPHVCSSNAHQTKQFATQTGNRESAILMAFPAHPSSCWMHRAVRSDQKQSHARNHTLRVSHLCSGPYSVGNSRVHDICFWTFLFVIFELNQTQLPLHQSRTANCDTTCCHFVFGIDAWLRIGRHL